MNKYLFFGFLALFFFFNSPVSAKGAQLVQAAPNKVSLPLIVGGQNENINQPVDRDLVVGGQNVTVSSTVNGDAYVAGGDVTISGNITNNLIVAGGKVKVLGDIGRNLIMAGGEVSVESGSKISGYILGAGNTFDLKGQSSGPVKIGANTLNVADQASIGGNLEADVAQANIANGAKIAGERKINIHQVETPNRVNRASRGLAGFSLFSFLSSLLVLLLLVRLFGKFFDPAVESLRKALPVLGTGFLVLIATPFLVVGLLATFIGIPLAIILLLIFLLALYLSNLFVAGVLGRLINDRGWLRIDNIYLQATIGLIILSVLEIIPFIGAIVRFIVLLFGLGMFWRLLKTKTI